MNSLISYKSWTDIFLQPHTTDEDGDLYIKFDAMKLYDLAHFEQKFLRHQYFRYFDRCAILIAQKICLHKNTKNCYDPLLWSSFKFGSGLKSHGHYSHLTFCIIYLFSVPPATA